jgi:hypothetical protein
MILNPTQYKSVSHQELRDYGVGELQLMDLFWKTPNEVQEMGSKGDFFVIQNICKMM